MNKEQLEQAMKDLIDEIVLSATLTVSIYEKAKTLSKEIKKEV
jgi:hypothetical protein